MTSAPPSRPRSWRHWSLVAFGWTCVGLGVVGAVLPVLPTTPFLLLALWAFGRSSERFHGWLLNHRWLGRYVAEWERHRVIPVRAKVAALTAMAVSLTWAVLSSTAPWYALAAMAAVMAYGAWFVLSKPSRPRAE
ncbi:MAG: YbaN family protein [Magnetospirillum sp.]|nr:YbaN family protein [Magnetospirillum sp.]